MLQIRVSFVNKLHCFYHRWKSSISCLAGIAFAVSASLMWVTNASVATLAFAVSNIYFSCKTGQFKCLPCTIAHLVVNPTHCSGKTQQKFPMKCQREKAQ